MKEVLFQHVYPGDVLIHGNAPGADRLSEEEVEKSHVTIERYSADWGRDGRKAGPIRNQRMLDEGKPDLVIAFPGGKGTADMVRRAMAAGIKVICDLSKYNPQW